MEDRYNVECCDFIHAHEEIVEKVRQELPDEGPPPGQGHLPGDRGYHQ